MTKKSTNYYRRESDLIPNTDLKSSSIDLLMYLWKSNLLVGAKCACHLRQRVKMDRAHVKCHVE